MLLFVLLLWVLPRPPPPLRRDCRDTCCGFQQFGWALASFYSCADNVQAGEVDRRQPWGPKTGSGHRVYLPLVASVGASSIHFVDEQHMRSGLLAGTPEVNQTFLALANRCGFTHPNNPLNQRRHARQVGTFHAACPLRSTSAVAAELKLQQELPRRVFKGCSYRWVRRDSNVLH